MFNFNSAPTIKKIDTKGEEEKKLQDELKHRASMDAQAEVGGINPTDTYRRHSISSNDEGYMQKVEALTNKKLSDPEWVNKTKELINKSPTSYKGEDNTLYHAGSGKGGGALKEYANQNYGDDKRKAA